VWGGGALGHYLVTVFVCILLALGFPRSTPAFFVSQAIPIRIRWPEETGELITSVVRFYTQALNYGRFADAAPTAEQAYTQLQSLAPRLKMAAELLIKTMEKFEASGFAVDADIKPTPAEITTIAARVGYPLEEVARERGLDINAIGQPRSTSDAAGQ
jgi:hypothetical protein